MATVERKIDYDRGVMFMQEQTTGVNIYMYFDEPGHYRNHFGDEVNPMLAQQAGFNTEKWGKLRVKNERMAKAMTAIEAELATAGDAKAEPVYEKAGYKVMDLGVGRHNVLDPDGNVLNTLALPLEVAQNLVDMMTKSDDTDAK